MVLVKNGHFFNFFFLGNTGQENVFHYILERKNAFLGHKKRISKSRKMDIFPKGFTHCFGPKMPFLPTFFFQGIQAKKMSFTIFWSETTPFYAIKTKSLTSRKIDIFQNRLTHGFGLKMAIFRTFFFRQYGPGKCLLRYSRAKKHVSKL